MRELTKRLQAGGALPVFLMADASPLEADYRRTGGTSLRLRFGRRDLPRPRRASYVLMFELVNRAAVAARGNRARFLRHYDAEVKRFKRSQVGRNVDRVLAGRATPLLPAVVAAAARGRPVVIVDTGMQGTFALYAARWFETRLGMPPLSVGVQLVAAYPWLSALYRDWHVTTQSRVVGRLEKDRPTWTGSTPARRSRSSAAGPDDRDDTGSRIRS